MQWHVCGRGLWHAAFAAAAPRCHNSAPGQRRVPCHRSTAPTYKTLQDTIGATPLVRLQRLPGADIEARGNVILGKLEGNNPAGSVKDRPALSMIRRAEERGDIKPGDTLIEATSGNTGIALAMAAAMLRLPHGAGHAGGPVDRARADDEGLSAPN